MFKPNFIITPHLATTLITIESLRQTIEHLPISSTVLSSMRESARLESVHYSTYIEGNRLTQDEISKVLYEKEHFPSRERDEKEVLGYYAALEYMESLITQKSPITEHVIQSLHALVMGGGKKRVKPTPYRDGQNVIRNSSDGKIVYLPPEAKDVPQLMKNLVQWISKDSLDLPCPLRAGIAHYQFATIHPYYDGNGRIARLLTSLILHLGGYGLKGLYSLEEYYAKNLNGYYQALSIGPSHNYYFGRAEADITPWIEYFCAGMFESFEYVKKEALKAQRKGLKDISQELTTLDLRQRKVLQSLRKKELFTAQDIAKLLKIKPRTTRALCQRWVANDFLSIVDPSKKNRIYSFSKTVKKLL